MLRTTLKRTRGRLAAGTLLAATLGATTMTMPAAASETAPAYLVVIGKGWDREKMGAYARSLPPVYAAANGRYLAIGGPGRGVEWVAAPAHFRDRSLVLARFDSPAAVQAFWWGEGYRDAMKNRYAAGAFTVVTLAGTADDAAAKAGPEAGFLYEAHVVADEAAYAEYARARAAALAAYGGRLLVDVEPGNFVALEGDPVYDRVALVHFPTRAQRDAFLAAPAAAELAKLRDRAGLAFVARADGAQAPAASVTNPGAAAPSR
ncbi:MAG: DUF1330 domain-containing protein [Pseudomonadota bacterium]